MKLIKGIREAIKVSKEFEKRLREVERNVLKPTHDNKMSEFAFNLRSWFMPPPLYEKIEELESEIKDLKKDNEMLYEFLGVEVKHKKEKRVLKKKQRSKK
jgi:hypothetical protein